MADDPKLQVQPQPDPTPKPGATPSPKPNDPSPKPSDKPDPKPAKKAGSIYEDLGDPEPGEKGAAAWAEDWREQLATDDAGKVDDKQLAVLKRYDSPKAYHKASMAARQRISSGEYRRGMPDPTDTAAVAEWRKENNVPEKADDYPVPLPQGVTFDQLDEGTKAGLNGFREAFHKINLPVAQAEQLMAAANEIAADQAEATAMADANNQDTNEDTLRTDWGASYRPNVKMNFAFLTKEVGAEERDAVLNARTPDGRRLCDIPAFNKFLNNQARLAGSDEFVESDGTTKGGTLEGRRAEIEKIMAADFTKYKAEGLDKEYAGILQKLDDKGKLDKK